MRKTFFRYVGRLLFVVLITVGALLFEANQDSTAPVVSHQGQGDLNLPLSQVVEATCSQAPSSSATLPQQLRVSGPVDQEEVNRVVSQFITHMMSQGAFCGGSDIEDSVPLIWRGGERPPNTTWVHLVVFEGSTAESVSIKVWTYNQADDAKILEIAQRFPE